MRFRLDEALLFAGKLSTRKVVNYAKIRLAYLISIVFKKPVVWGYPSFLSAEPTTSCNLQCVECPTGQHQLSRPAGDMLPETFKHLIDESSPCLLSVLLYYQGEPFLNRHLSEFIAYAHEKRVFSLLSTNGHFLSPEKCREIIVSGLDKIIISLDGVDQETYSTYRKGGNVETVWNGIKTLSSMKKTLGAKNPVISVQFLVMKHNENQINIAKKKALEAGANSFVLKSLQVTTTINSGMLPANSKYSRYSSQNGFRIKKKLLNRCLRIWQSLVVLHNGDVVSCCFDKNAEYLLGNLKQDRFVHIWKGETFTRLRLHVLKTENQFVCVPIVPKV
ncbi:MAG: radical SAM protein [Bacteroidales bacterium]|nr:radical SAM protein [Bacteroidales bacterium]